MYYIYAIKSNLHNRIYVGLTQDLESRLREHNSGRTKSTKYYRPWEMFYIEEASSLKIAREREKKLKSGYGKELLKELLRDAPVAHKDRAAVS
ncbi:MAG: GIY-YIG nuclease family protein [Candidatus Omnitrophota bacterium]